MNIVSDFEMQNIYDLTQLNPDRIKERGGGIEPPRSRSKKVGNAPALPRNEVSKSLHPFPFCFGYMIDPAILPPYCGIPKFATAVSCLPRRNLGDVTTKLFLSTTNLPETVADIASIANNIIGICIIVGCTDP